jgi:riboflavin kinase/FMN adenylyltransferase
VGQKPTVTDDEAGEVLAETYLYDYEGDLYGTKLTVQFCQFHREEEKFDGLDVLKAQLQKDMEAGRKFWA